MDDEKISLEKSLLFILSWAFGISIMLKSVSHINPALPIEKNLLPLVLSGVGLFLMFLPFFKSIKIPKILELERNVRETKEELTSFKQQISSSLAVLATNISTSISNVNHNSNSNIINISANELKRESKRVDKKLASNAKHYLDDVTSELNIEDEDVIMNLARVRILIEMQLRRILGKTTGSAESMRPVKYLNLSSLVNMFTEKYPNYSYLKNSFRYVIQICNAAMHAQQVNISQANEAIGLGAKLIADLRSINE